jgi:hypothetical protein
VVQPLLSYGQWDASGAKSVRARSLSRGSRRELRGRARAERPGCWLVWDGHGRTGDDRHRDIHDAAACRPAHGSRGRADPSVGAPPHGPRAQPFHRKPRACRRSRSFGRAGHRLPAATERRAKARRATMFAGNAAEHRLGIRSPGGSHPAYWAGGRMVHWPLHADGLPAAWTVLSRTDSRAAATAVPGVSHAGTRRRSRELRRDPSTLSAQSLLGPVAFVPRARRRKHGPAVHVSPADERLPFAPSGSTMGFPTEPQRLRRRCRRLLLVQLSSVEFAGCCCRCGRVDQGVVTTTP